MNIDLYVITDEKAARGLPVTNVVERAIAGGADVIQFRDKTCSSAELFRTAQVLRTITRGSGTLFLINDRLDVAVACGADGVHLGQSDLPAGTARQLVPEGFIIGVSVGTVEEAVAAEAGGADYVALSPTFPTATKGDAGPGHGLGRLAAVRRAVAIPVVAIGGIHRGNVRDVIAAGADGVAVISAVVGSPDIAAAARELKDLVQKSKRELRQ